MNEACLEPRPRDQDYVPFWWQSLPTTEGCTCLFLLRFVASDGVVPKKSLGDESQRPRHVRVRKCAHRKENKRVRRLSPGSNLATQHSSSSLLCCRSGSLISDAHAWSNRKGTFTLPWLIDGTLGGLIVGLLTPCYMAQPAGQLLVYHLLNYCFCDDDDDENDDGGHCCPYLLSKQWAILLGDVTSGA